MEGIGLELGPNIIPSPEQDSGNPINSLAQLYNFNSTKFEKSLTPSEVDKFRPYMLSYHILKLYCGRLRQQLKDNGIEPEEVVPHSAM